MYRQTSARCAFCGHLRIHTYTPQTRIENILACASCPDGKCLPPRMLGQDDWLVFVRLAHGTLVYTVIETDWHWLETPSKGDAPYGSCRWRIDNLWMQFHVWRHFGDYTWKECDLDTDGVSLAWPPEKDDEFVRHSEQTYLPEFDDASGTWRDTTA